ncbi:hypothetical protein [Metabacillus sp. Hm71]|uniref:hypothetical protein n=1 Tax=Metabacillus sp. Hm71 TaxID=3450743 RepID=UPI003F43C86A
MRDGLKTMLCVPGKDYPYGDKRITARVQDDKHTEFIQFGPDVTRKTIMNQIPIIYMDRVYDKRRRKKAI